MKKTKKSSNTVTRIISIAITFALILCAVLSFGFIYIPQGALADGEDQQPTATQENVDGIRFVQVAAGSDFAIGLTFDGDLYGWSLLPETGTPCAGTNTYSSLSASSTLGQYYSTTPTKINVKLIMGPSASSSNAWGEAGYISTNETDRIKEIAATRTTAAFVTDQGFVYTWGNDDASFEGVTHNNEITGYHYLLLRSVSDDYRWCEPYMINYSGFAPNDAAVINQINPASSSFVKNSVSIAAGEYNYIILYAKNNRLNTYAWGSLVYSVPNTSISEDGYDSSSPVAGGANVRLAFDIGRTSAAEASVVAGGYTVGINNASRGDGSTSLQLRGKNFLTSTGTQSSIVYTTETSNGSVSSIVKASTSGGSTTYQVLAANGIIGGKQTKNEGNNLLSGNQGLMTYNGDNDTLRLNASDNYYGRQASDSEESTIDYQRTRTGTISGAHGSALTGNTYRLYGVSLGNDIGYGIDGNGKLFAWGDNGTGQLTDVVTDPNATKPTQINDTGSVLSGKTFDTVAAGKQLSGSAKAFHATSTFVASGDTAGQFITGVKNTSAFISGAVTLDGELWVWSDKNSTPVEVKYGNYGATDTVQNGDKFRAVYSGYGNHLFAITRLGKLVHITYTATDATTGEGDDAVTTTTVTYNQERYDAFRKFVIDENGIVISENGIAKTELIKNWEVNSANTVHFTNADANHAQYATFYVWSGANLVATTSSTQERPTVYAPLVSLNNIGDAYRILSGNEKDNARLFLNEVDGRDSIVSFAPVYKYDGVEMTEKQRKNMFAADIVNDENGVGIRITPKQSSKGKTITVDFYIARYANTADVTAPNNVLSDNAQYYDYKPCRISFDIADTATMLAFGKYRGGASSENTNSLIPLLDPNNDYNNTYSVAVQDVSGGVEALYDYFYTGGLTLASGVTKSSFSGAIADLMAAKDPGYPLAAKRAEDKGNLDYYLGELTAPNSTTTLAETLYYSNKYQYLYSDIDADMVKISANPDKIGTNRGIATAITPTTEHITVSFDLATYFTGLRATNDLITQFKKDFNNLYGFYDVYFGPKNDTEAEVGKTATTITFTYDIVTFAAEEATGLITYNVPESNTDTAVSSYKTDSTASGVLLSVTPTVQTYDFNATAENTAYVPINVALEGREIIAVYSMPSLRMKSEYNVNKTENNPGTQINGNHEGVHVYNETYSSPIYIGKSETINLRKYFNSLGNDMIKFSFKGGAANADYDTFNKQFMDETGNGVKIVDLTANSLKIEPTTTNPIKLTVVMQRFANGANATFGANERIEATFIFNNIVDFSFVQPQNIITSYEITKEETFNLFGMDGSKNFGKPLAVNTLSVDPTAQTKLMSQVKITGLTSSEDVNNSARLFDVRPSGATSLIVTPRRSGTGTVQFIASVYGKSVFYSLTINVSAVTVIDDSITVVDDQYIYIETFKNKLKEANAFLDKTGVAEDKTDNYDILYTDIANPEASQLEKRYNAIYFTEGTVDGDPLTDPPAFIRNAIIQGVNSEGNKTETKPSIRIISADSSVDSSKTYYMHVKFVNKVKAVGATTYAEAPAGTVLEAVIPIVSGKVVVNAYSVDINCRSPKSDENGRYTITGSGVDTRVTVRVSSLLDSLGGNIESSTEYTISLVSAEPEVSEYLNYSRGADQKTIIITPLYNTPEGGCQISVSASYNNDSKVLLFYVNIDGITTVLPVTTDENGVIGYGNIWLYSFLIVFGVLAIIFVIRMIVYWKKRAKQRALIKRNQELIRLRDRMHNKASIATKEQVVKTKLKMNDPKYAKMFNDMRKSKEEESGVILENSELAATADAKVKKNKKKKGGKKSVAELKAELEAKKAAFAAAQAQGAQPVNPFVADVPPMDGGGDFAPPVDDFGGAQSIDGSDIVFDASDMGEGM